MRHGAELRGDEDGAKRWDSITDNGTACVQLHIFRTDDTPGYFMNGTAESAPAPFSFVPACTPLPIYRRSSQSGMADTVVTNFNGTCSNKLSSRRYRSSLLTSFVQVVPMPLAVGKVPTRHGSRLDPLIDTKTLDNT